MVWWKIFFTKENKVGHPFRVFFLGLFEFWKCILFSIKVIKFIQTFLGVNNGAHTCRRKMVNNKVTFLHVKPFYNYYVSILK